MATAAGCGSDDGKDGPGAHAELVGQANAICRKADAPTPAKDTGMTFDSLRELKNLYRGDAARARRAEQQIGRLRASQADRPKLRALRKSFGQLVVTNEEAGDIKALPQIRIYSALTVAANKVAFERAAALGARHCPPLTASGSYLTAVSRNRKAGKPVPPPASERTAEADSAEKDDDGEDKSAESHPVLGRWTGRATQYGPGKKRYRVRYTLVARSATVGASGGRARTRTVGGGFDCAAALQVDQATERAVLYRETTTTRGGGCYPAVSRTRVERKGERLTFRSTVKTEDGRAVTLGVLSKRP